MSQPPEKTRSTATADPTKKRTKHRHLGHEHGCKDIAGCLEVFQAKWYQWHVDSLCIMTLPFIGSVKHMQKGISLIAVIVIGGAGHGGSGQEATRTVVGVQCLTIHSLTFPIFHENFMPTLICNELQNGSVVHQNQGQSYAVLAVVKSAGIADIDDVRAATMAKAIAEEKRIVCDSCDMGSNCQRGGEAVLVDNCAGITGRKGTTTSITWHNDTMPALQ
ncbi:hypothetical protein BD769DRAFT_1383936 [Suillus cothurnatus]|nr:hypothetical protein BD769DRAFT_1383936 [Suillus cothurnatus]